MKIKTIDLEPKRYIIYFLGDIHEGAANYQQTAFQNAVKLIQNEADAWIGMGDYIDAINHLDPRFNPKEVGAKYSLNDLDDFPRVQCYFLLKELDPIKDKCLGLIYGNHEDSYRKHNTFDVVNYLSERLGCDNLGHKAWISLNFRFNANKSIPYKIVVMHGSGGGGGMREGAPLNRVHDVFRWDMADAHVIGHLHQAGISRPVYNRFEYGMVRREPSWFAVNGCFLSKTELDTEGYSEQKAGMESSIGAIKLTICPHSGDKSRFTSQMQMIWL